MITLMAALVATASTAEAAPRRIAVVVGNNQADASRGRLRYAERDARQMSRVLESLGAVDRAHLLLDRSAADLADALRRVAVEAGSDATLLFFYSGHADEQAMLMRDTRFGFGELRDALQKLPVKLFVAFIDACQAGSIARMKGGHAVPVVDVDFYDDEKRYSGGIFITSGAPGENAQESDELEASFFTHYLLSGLRGAADASGDRRVSLEEAYRFAYRHTLERTKGTLLGPQHPTRDVDVEGRGQLVLTWLSERSSYLVLPAAARGTYYLRGEDRADLVAEVTKDGPNRVRIALEPGRYEVAKAEGGLFLSQEVDVPPKSEHLLDDSAMQARPLAQMQVKGGPRASTSRLAVTYRLRSGFLIDAGPSHGASAAYSVMLGALAIGPTVGYAGSRYRRADGLDVRTSEVEAGVRLTATWYALPRVGFFAGVELLLAWTAQRGETSAGQSETITAVTFPERAIAGIEIDLFSPVALLLLGHAGLVAYEGPAGVTAGFVAGAGAGLELRL